ncbi:MAG: AAA family ATPase [Planctomycetota bacterium]|nr:MAG: AAA family ATPase [Planctomycetota bacterium]
MLDEQTHQKLMSMKMYGLAADFQTHLDGHSDDSLSFEERFGLMVDREWTERQERKLNLRLGRAKLREKSCLEDIDYRHPRGLDRSVINRLAACRWIGEHENIILTGPTGLGKTWIACALADNACRKGHTAHYTRVPRLLQDLAIAQADGTYTRALNRLAKTDVLILDDWGLAPLTDRERRDMLEIIEDRRGRRSTIVTSQLPVKKWHDHIGDPTIADSILDRLVHNAHRIELKGQSLRKRRSGKPKRK